MIAPIIIIGLRTVSASEDVIGDPIYPTFATVVNINAAVINHDNGRILSTSQRICIVNCVNQMPLMIS